MMPLNVGRITEPLKAAQRLGNLIGRDEELQRIETIFKNIETPAVVYLEGPGGIGKTTLSQAVRRRLDAQGRVVRDLIDLYHVEHQSRIGIIESIVRNLDDDQAFTEYQRAYRELQRKMAGGVEGADTKLQELCSIFLNDLERLSEQQPVLIALDTAEVFGYEQDRFQRETKLELPELTVGKWLVDTIILPSRGRVLWLVSGRPADLTLYDHLHHGYEQGAITSLEKLEVQRLDRQASRQYFEAVIEFLLKSGKPLEAQRIKNTLQQSSELLYALSEGRPILLALIADILSQGGSLPDPGDTERRAHALLQNLLRLNHPIGLILRTMACLPKGVDAELLRQAVNVAEGLDISLKEAEDYLTQVDELVLVKKYASPLKSAEPTNQRYFLHDELYELFERYQDDITTTRVRLLPALSADYDQQERKISDELRLEPTWERCNYLQHRRDVLRVERLYYQMLTDFDAGIEQYFLLAEDWMDARQRDAYLMLYTHIISAIQKLQRTQLLKAHQIETVDLNQAVRWGMGKLLFDEDPQGARAIFDKIREWPLFKQARIRVPLWHLRLYEAVAFIRLGNREEAAEILSALEREINVKIVEIRQQQRPLPKVVTLLLALTYHYQGYLKRLELDYYSAIDLYRKAIAPFKQLQAGMLISEYEHIIYAMAQVGWSRRGRQIFHEAIGVAKQQGQPLWEARLHNVMVVLETLDGHFPEAREFGMKTLKKLQHAPNPRWENLACVNLAHTYRHLWNWSVSLREWGTKWPETLKIAFELLETKGSHAVLDTDSAQEGQEPPMGALVWLRAQAREKKDRIYYVEALVEAGCIEREMAWLYWRYKKAVESSLLSTSFNSEKWEAWASTCEQAANQAEAYFFEAAGLKAHLANWRETHGFSVEVWEKAVEAQIEQLGGGRYWPVLALVNLGWHWRYQRQVTDETIEVLCVLVETLIPKEYHLPVPTRKRGDAGTEIFLWAVLGKMEMLRFDVCVRFDEWQAKDTLDAKMQQEMEKRFEVATPHLVYSLEYNRLLGEAAFDRGRAEDGLAQRLSMIKQHHHFVIPQLYKCDEEFVSNIVKQYGNNAAAQEEEAKNQVTSPSELQRWLKESYGGPELW